MSTFRKKISLQPDTNKTWNEYYGDDEVVLSNLYIERTWKKIISKEFEKEYFKVLEKFLTSCVKKTKNSVKFYPYPELIFKAFNTLPFKKVKVVILGQDPYYRNETHNNIIVPQATGLAFSVPKQFKIPSSLNNIYKNLVKYNHLKETPKHGNLEKWTKQGVLLLNTALTVQHGYANSHKNVWQKFTDYIIKYISDKKENLVFVLWGSNSLKKLTLIFLFKHKIIISSHPSGLSCNKRLKHYKEFVNVDHFGLINEYLKKNKKKEINWSV